MKFQTNQLFSWCLTAFLFSAGAVGGAHAAPLELGSAGGYGALAATALTNTGPSAISGDIGVSPGSSITGFPPGTRTGTTHLADTSANAAQADALSTYNAINASVCSASYGAAQDLTALSPISPGVYCFTSSAIMTGPVTLAGPAGSEFVFKIANSLTVSSNATMTASGGAASCKAFWGVGSAATLGTGSTFLGNIIAAQDATLNTGSKLSGGVYALNGAVTLDTNNVQACGTPTVASIPTLSEWGVILLTGFMMFVVFFRLKKTRSTSRV